MRFSAIVVILLSHLSFATIANAACSIADSSSYVLRGDEAIDPERGLVWKRCAVGMLWDAKAQTCSGETYSLSLHDARDFATKEGDGWRVPSGQELETVLVETCGELDVDAVAFPAIAAADFGEGAKFWTSTEAIPGMFYFFDFTNGFVDMHSTGFRLSVLLVKDIAR